MSFSWVDDVFDDELRELHSTFDENINKAQRLIADLVGSTDLLFNIIDSFHLKHPPTEDYDLFEFFEKVFPECLGPPSMYPKPILHEEPIIDECDEFEVDDMNMTLLQSVPEFPTVPQIQPQISFTLDGNFSRDTGVAQSFTTEVSARNKATVSSISGQRRTPPKQKRIQRLTTSTTRKRTTQALF